MVNSGSGSRWTQAHQDLGRPSLKRTLLYPKERSGNTGFGEWKHSPRPIKMISNLKLFKNYCCYLEFPESFPQIKKNTLRSP